MDSRVRGRRAALPFAFALAVSLLPAPPAEAGRRVFAARDLGTFEGGPTSGTALNDRGQIVGVSWSGTTPGAFLRDGDTTVSLGTMTAVDINNAGQILLQTVAGNPDDATFCLLREPDGTLTTLGTPAGSQCFAADLNEAGQVVGSVQRLAGTLRVTSGFLWDHGDFTDLGTLGGDIVLAARINDLGQVVGSATTPSGYEHAFLWQQGTMIDLGAPDGVSSRAPVINNRGQVALSSGAHLYLREPAGTLTDLGTMGRPDVPQQASVPLDLNERGQILVAVYDIGSARYLWGLFAAGRWTPLPGLGAGAPSAERLNELGQVIGTDVPAGTAIRHMVFWTSEVVRGRRR